MSREISPETLYCNNYALSLSQNYYNQATDTLAYYGLPPLAAYSISTIVLSKLAEKHPSNQSLQKTVAVLVSSAIPVTFVSSISYAYVLFAEKYTELSTRGFCRWDPQSYGFTS